MKALSKVHDYKVSPSLRSVPLEYIFCFPKRPGLCLCEGVQSSAGDAETSLCFVGVRFDCQQYLVGLFLIAGVNLIVF